MATTPSGRGKVWVHRRAWIEQSVMLEYDDSSEALEEARALPPEAWNTYFISVDDKSYGLAGVSLSDEREPYNSPKAVADRAFEQHLADHGCGKGGPPFHGYANCPSAAALFRLLDPGSEHRAVVATPMA